MASLLLPIIYLAFISLGLPDALLGAAWPTMYPQLGAQVSWAGGVSMIISACTILTDQGSFSSTCCAARQQGTMTPITIPIILNKHKFLMKTILRY